MKNELEEYIKIDDNYYYDDMQDFNKNFHDVNNCKISNEDLNGNFENLESFDQIIKEKNCLIEELKNYTQILKLKFEEEILKYSKEVILTLIIDVDKRNEIKDMHVRREIKSFQFKR